MKCQSCGEVWSLECGLGPGGAMAPGSYSYFAVGVAVVGATLGYYVSWLIILVGGVIAVLLLGMAFCGCGYQVPRTAYQGSECPKCGTRNWIWPWNL